MASDLRIPEIELDDIHVSERPDRRRRSSAEIVEIMTAAAGLIALVVSDAAPAGLTIADGLYRGAFAALVVWFASRARRWTWVFASTIAAVVASSLFAQAFAVIAIAVGALGMGASVAHGASAGLAAATLQATLGTATGLYRGRWRLASFDEAVALSGVVAAVAAAVAGAVALGAWLGVTLAFNFLAPFAALSAMLFARGFKRGLSERRSATALQDQTRVLVFGAGDAGAQLIRSMLGNPHSVYRPVALFDDDSTKAKLRIQGVPVRGSRQDIAAVARDTGTLC